MPLVLGMFQMLRAVRIESAFLWVRDLAKPDLIFAFAAALTVAVLMAANPGLPEQYKTIMIILPSVLTLVFALKFSAGLALYWVISNLFAAAQTAYVHWLVERRVANA